MGIEVGQASKNLKSGGKFYAYSGVVQGGPTIPAFVTLIDILSTGLRDSFIKIKPFFAAPASTSLGDALGIKVLIDDVEVYESKPGHNMHYATATATVIELFIPRQSRLTVESINTSGNTLQDRGVTMLGWYL